MFDGGHAESELEHLDQNFFQYIHLPPVQKPCSKTTLPQAVHRFQILFSFNFTSHVIFLPEAKSDKV